MVTSMSGEPVVILLARGGSKGIPRKNVLDFCGQPLIAWSIQQAFDAGVQRVIVSTDDFEIASVAARYGAEVVNRPDDLAGDDAPGDAAVVHAADELRLSDATTLVIPQVTSPLRMPHHIVEIQQLVSEGAYDSAFSAVRIDDICVWSMESSPRSLTYDFRVRAMRQDRSPLVVENGSLYCTQLGAMRSSQNRLNGNIGIFLMPKWTLPEIDEPDDVRQCAVLMEAYVKPMTSNA